MAHFSQEMKKAIAPEIARICKAHGIKGTLSVRNGMKVVLTLKGGKVDFNADQAEVFNFGEQHPAVNYHNGKNVGYHWAEAFREGTGARAFLAEVMPVLNRGNYSNTDSQRDYFDDGFYVGIEIGRYDRPYEMTA
jgi:hypothetical protein